MFYLDLCHDQDELNSYFFAIYPISYSLLPLSGDCMLVRLLFSDRVIARQERADLLSGSHDSI